MGEGTRSNAEARRSEVVEAAAHVFGERGFYGTATKEVAAAAGISQPYIYRLFPDKEALFVAVVQHVSERLLAALASGAARARSAEGAEVLRAMTEAHEGLVREKHLLMLLLQANAAAAEPAIRTALRDCYGKQVEYIRAVAGATDEQIREMLGQSMLANVMVAIHASEVDAPWARTLTEQPPHRATTP